MKRVHRAQLENPDFYYKLVGVWCFINWCFINLSRRSTICSFGTCIANTGSWRPVILNYILWFLSLCWWQFWQNKVCMQLNFLKYKHEKVETIVFQAVVSYSHPSSEEGSRMLSAAGWSAAGFSHRLDSLPVEDAEDRSAIISPCWEVPAATELRLHVSC